MLAPAGSARAESSTAAELLTLNAPVKVLLPRKIASCERGRVEATDTLRAPVRLLCTMSSPPPLPKT